MRLVVVLLLLGFPIAIIFTWAYEITPEGIKRTEDLTPEESIKGATGRKLNSLIIGVLLCVIAFLVFQRFRSGHGPSALGRARKKHRGPALRQYRRRKGRTRFLPMASRTIS